MSDVLVPIWDNKAGVARLVKYHDNGDGSFSPVMVVADVPVSLTAEDIEIGGVEIKDGATDTRAKVKSDGTDYALVVTQNSVPLASGAASGAKQDTGNTSLSSIDGKLTGAPHAANGQVTAGAASGVLLAARATRRSFVVRNHDTANSAYIGKGTVTSANGFLLKAGESIAIESVEAWNCIRDTADVQLSFIELFD